MRSALAVISFLMFAMPCSSEEKGQSSSDWIENHVNAELANPRLCNNDLDSSQVIPSKYLKSLVIAYRAYLNEARAAVTKILAESHPELQIRETIPFLGQEYPVLAVLGSGTSGVFYAVQTPEGIRTAEEFYDPEVAKRVGHFLSRADLHVLGQDGRIVMEEFVLGLPEYRVTKGKSLVQLGVKSPVAANEIAKWMTARFPADNAKHDRDDILIEIPSGRIVELFPYPSDHEPDLVPNPIQDPVREF